MPKDVRAYTLANSTKVRDVALPAPVVADMTAKAQATIVGGLGAAMKASLQAAGVAAGRRVIAVFPIHGTRPGASHFSSFWSTTMTPGEFYDTAAQAQAALAGIVAANPTGNVVVVLGK